MMIDNLEILVEIKNDIKTAIEDAGGEITGGLITYADSIRYPVLLLPPGLKFYNSYNVADYDYSNYTDMSYMFWKELHDESMPELTSINLLGTSNVTNMRLMFYNTSIQNINLFDTSNVTDFVGMFEGTPISNIPMLDTRNGELMGSMFMYTKISEFPKINIHNAITISQIARHCENLVSIPLLDGTNLHTASSAFAECHALTNIAGIKNFGKNPDMTSNTIKNMFGSSSLITEQSCINIFNNLYDRATAGYSIVNMSFEPEVIARLTDEDIAIATNKGWTITTIN